MWIIQMIPNECQQNPATKVHYVFMSIRKKKYFKELTPAYDFSYTTCKIHAAIMGQAGVGIAEI